MAKTDPTVAAYIAAQPAPARRALKQVRSAIRKALPVAEEVISYKIPAYRLDGSIVIYFASWAQHYALYPVGGALVAALKTELAPYELSNKGTVRFPLDRPVPVELIARIARLRAKEVAEGKRTKPAAAAKKKGRTRTRAAKPQG